MIHHSLTINLYLLYSLFSLIDQKIFQKEIVIFFENFNILQHFSKYPIPPENRLRCKIFFNFYNLFL